MLSVVVPTYNERDNIRQLLGEISAVLSDLEFESEVVVVDDDSPDETARVARTVAEELGLDARVIIRTSNPDLSRSVLRGFREARGEVIAVMDADLQHPPEVLPKLAAAVSTESPIAIATRYGQGGRIENWPLSRRVVSYGAMILTKVLVPPARGVSDPISGFFAVHADAFRADELTPYGYKILIELLATIDPERISEVGFTFESREHGQTSLDGAQYLRFLRHVIDCGIRYRSSQFGHG